MAFRLPFSLAAAAALLLAGGAAGAAAQLAAVGHPVSIPLPRGGLALAAGRGHAVVEVAVTGYQPSRDGPVTLVIEGQAGGAPVEIGRVGLFPDRPFTAAEPDKAQRFSLPLPASLPAARLRALTVRIDPTLGTGAAARAQVAGRLVFRR